MPIQDISKVTDTLSTLLTTYLAKQGIENANIETCPPDKVTPPALCLHLYHVAEDPYFKSLREPDRTTSAVGQVPMGLNLFYRLSAHADEDQQVDEIQKQMGYAVKALHDFPIIGASTTITDKDGNVIPVSLLETDDNIRIVLQPISYSEAINFWAAASTPLRLAAYYQVSVVFLEAEGPPVGAGRVLAYDVQTFTEGLPHIDSSQNLLSYLVPSPDASANPTPMRVLVQSAMTPPADVPPPSVPPGTPIPRPETLPSDLVSSELILSGSGFVPNATRLFVRDPSWDQPQLPTDDQCWWVLVTSDSVSAVVRTTIGSASLSPGIYAASVGVTRQQVMSDGATVPVEYLSNECPFMVVPRIDSVASPSGTQGYFEVTGFGLQADTQGEQRVCVGSIELVATTSDSLAAGEYLFTPEGKLHFVLPSSGLTSGTNCQLRIIVNGAESTPNWIKVP
jgi:hypothetical protein